MSKPQIDSMDVRILEALQADGRLTMVELGDRVGLSPSPCHRRVCRLAEDGFIKGHTTLLDRKRLGLGLTVFMEIKIDGHRDKNAAILQAEVLAMDEVIACHVVSGEADFLVEVVVPDLAHYERLLFDRFLKMPMVKDVRSNFSIREVKSGGRLSLAHLV